MPFTHQIVYMSKAKSRKYIHKLRYVKRLKGKPGFIRNHKVYGARKAGLIYERRVATYLQALHPRLYHYGPWFEYEDVQGRGWCQPDILFLPYSKKKPLVIYEIKLTYKPIAEHKLYNVYKPIVEYLYPKRDIKLCQIFKNLTKGFNNVLIDNPSNLIQSNISYATWNFRNPPSY